MPHDCAERVVVPKSSAWTNYVWSILMDWTAPHLTTLRFFRTDDLNFYFADFDSATDTVRIGKVVAGVTTILASGTTDLSVPARRGVLIQALRIAGPANQIDVYVDADLVVSSIGDNAHEKGSVEVYLDAGSADGSAVINRTEVYEVPLTIVHLGP
jgi:hypothetical protein